MSGSSNLVSLSLCIVVYVILFHSFFLCTGVVVYEYELKIGWGKSVSLPSQALPAPPPGHMAIRSKEVSSMFPSFVI